jgi:hypothetical protein
MYTIERHVGRLVEVRQIATVPLSLEEIIAFRDTLLGVVRAATEPVVFCYDLRQAALFAPPAAEEVSAMMREINPSLDRSAIVVPTERATFALQMERLVRAGGVASRRTFRSAKRAADWLGEVLSDEEKARLRVFLDL